MIATKQNPLTLNHSCSHSIRCKVLNCSVAGFIIYQELQIIKLHGGNEKRNTFCFFSSVEHSETASNIFSPRLMSHQLIYTGDSC
jgi:hypothetical protein